MITSPPLHRLSLAALLLFLVAAGAQAQPTPPDALEGEDLRTWFKTNWYDGLFDDQGYNGARSQMFGYVDANNGLIECIYTGFQQAAGYVTFPDPMNTEHLVPQSFFGSTGPLKSDLYNIRPSHSSANSARGNSMFAEVSDASAQWYGVTANGDYTTQGNTPANAAEWSERSGGFWEPREDQKGDIARAIFYAYTMYPTEAGVISDLASPEELLTWHENDPVSSEEIIRGTRVAETQLNSNPYLTDPMYVVRAWFPDLIIDPPPPPTDTTGTCSLFFSEYAEGSGFNKYLEIFNPTDSVISLSHFALAHTTNAPAIPGTFETWLPFTDGALIAPGGTYTVVHPSADASLVAAADQTYPSLSNGDDGFGLVAGTPDDYTVLDIIGTWDADPGSEWVVAGNGSTSDATLIRKPEVVHGNSGDWSTSAGTGASDSEWIVMPSDDFADFGTHTVAAIACVSGNDGGNGETEIPGCTYMNACNYDEAATDDDGTCDFTSCLLLGCTYGDALNYDPLADVDDGTCEFPACVGGACLTDLDGDAVTAVSDLLILLGAFGDVCPQ
jgi:hypothetical protein